MAKTVIVSARVNPIALAAILRYWESEGFTPYSMSHAIGTLVKGAAASLPKKFLPSSLEEAKEILDKIGMQQVTETQLRGLIREETLKRSVDAGDIEEKVKKALEVLETL